MEEATPCRCWTCEGEDEDDEDGEDEELAFEEAKRRASGVTAAFARATWLAQAMRSMLVNLRLSIVAQCG